MSLKSQIEGAMGDAGGLERLYRQAVAAEDEPAFIEVIGQCAGEHPEDILFSAWACRLNVQSPADAEMSEGQIVKESQTRHWRTAVATSVVLGILYALFAGDKPPVPDPGEARPLFWIGWGPLTALGVLFFLGSVERTAERIRRYGGPSVAVILIAVYSALIAWDRTDHIATLIAFHLPFVAWAAVGVGLTLGRPDPARQCYAFFIKTVEAILTGGIYFGAGVIFLGLTYGIFSVLGIKLPQDGVRTIAASGHWRHSDPRHSQCIRPHV